VEQLKGSSKGLAPALATNIRVGWKSSPGTNTLAYYDFFVNYGPWKKTATSDTAKFLRGICMAPRHSAEWYSA